MIKKPKEFEYFIANPHLNEKEGDCVIRSICKALDLHWDKVYKDLCDLGFIQKRMPNSKKVYEEYIKAKGFVKITVSNKKGSKRGTVLEFCKKNKEGIFILQTANHLVCVANGKFYDTWNCGDKSLYTIWQFKGSI